MAEHFGYDIDRRYLPVLLPFLVRPSNDGVTLTDEGTFIATFGLLKIVTPLSNVLGAHLTQNGTVALSAIDADPASGSALDGCRNPVFHVATEHFSTRIWVLSVLRIGRRGLTQQCRIDL